MDTETQPRFDSYRILMDAYGEPGTGGMNRAFRTKSLEQRVRILRRLTQESERAPGTDWRTHRKGTVTLTDAVNLKTGNSLRFIEIDGEHVGATFAESPRGCQFYPDPGRSFTPNELRTIAETLERAEW